jgi:hypothetical protein
MFVAAAVMVLEVVVGRASGTRGEGQERVTARVRGNKTQTPSPPLLHSTHAMPTISTNPKLRGTHHHSAYDMPPSQPPPPHTHTVTHHLPPPTWKKYMNTLALPSGMPAATSHTCDTTMS